MPGAVEPGIAAAVPMTPVILAERLTKSYGPRLAVDGVSLEVERGEVMGLLGPNGSGKTTILRILTGYLTPSSGTARIAGLDIVADAHAIKQRVGYVPENAPLYDGMRVRELLRFMARIKGLGRADTSAAIEGVVGRLALDRVMPRSIGTLSKGFRQRVAIAQALLGRPEILILDEPSNGLDPAQIIEMRGLIRGLAGEMTILVTSHILAEMERVADRVAILVEGRLLAVRALRASDSAVRLRVAARGDAALVHACLARVPGVRAVAPAAASRGDDHVYAVTVDGPDVAEAIAASVVGAGIGLSALERDRTDLEALFLELTGRAPVASQSPAVA
jgi:ABC-2 type transport system ATP-binding protein